MVAGGLLPLEKDPVVSDASSESDSPTLLQVFQRRKSFLLAALLIAATLLLYGPAANHKFLVLDDDEYVTANWNVASGFSLANIKWAFTTVEMGHWHPLTWLSHMLDCQLFGLNPVGHHYTNVLLHTLNAFLLFYLLMKATGSTWRSFTVAALFAVHPLNVESVAWLAERKTLLSAFWGFLMLAAYGWYVRANGIATSWYRYLAVLAAFVLALMSKAMAVTMPLALLLLDYWPLDRFAGHRQQPAGESPSTARTAAWLVIEKLPLFLISGISSYLAVVAARSAGALTDTVSVPLSLRLQNSVTACMDYLRTAIWPSGLSVYYPIQRAGIPWSKVTLALLIFAAITALTLKLHRRRYLLVGWLLFLVTLLPVSGIIQTAMQARADRYTYTPMIGVFIAVVWGAADLSKRLRIPRVALALASLCVLSGLALATRSTLGYWQDSITLMTRAEQVAGRPNAFIETILGKAYDVSGLRDEAVQHLNLAVSIDPHNAMALYNLGTIMLHRGQTSEAIPTLQSAIAYSKIAEVTESSHQNLATAYLMLGNYEAAERDYSVVLQMEPNRYNSLIGRGQAFFNDAKYEAAVSDFAHALQIAPSPQLWVWLGKSLEAQQSDAQAMSAYREALHGDPDSSEARARIASLQSKLQNDLPASVH